MHNRARGLCIRIRMRRTLARMLGALALCSAVEAAAPTVMSAQDWLAQVPPLPATAENAYAQWNDVSGVLTPNPTAQKVTDGIKAEILTMARVPDPPIGYSGRLSASDKTLVEKIDVFPDTGGVNQKIKAAQTDQAAVLQKWHAELNSLE